MKGVGWVGMGVFVAAGLSLAGVMMALALLGSAVVGR